MSSFINKTEADPAWVAGFNELSSNPTYPARLAVERISAELQNSDNPVNPSDQSPIIPTNGKQPTLAEIELLRKKETLVSKEVVYKQLFEFGQQLRDSLMAIPDRITAEILSAGDNPTKVRQILTDAIASSLESLTDLYNFQIGKV